jgi:hypothetical protein
MGRIQAGQDFSGSKTAGFLNNLLDKRDESLLAMLTALPQLELQAPPFSSQISCHGRIAVPAIIDAGDSFFFGLGVVHAEDIALQRNMSSLQGGNGCTGFFEEFHRRCIGKSKEARGNFIQSLTQSLSRRNSVNTQGLPEIVVFPAVGDGLEIALPNRKEAEVTSQDIVHANAAGAYWEAFLGFDRQRAQIIDTVSDEHESGVGGIKFFVGLLDDDVFHVHLPSEFM